MPPPVRATPVCTWDPTAPLSPFPLLSAMIVAPAASFICQLATGVAALPGEASNSTPASATERVRILRRMFVFPLRIDAVPRPCRARALWQQSPGRNRCTRTISVRNWA